MTERVLTSARIRVADSVQSVSKLFYARGWTDGLPIVPPTEEAVEEMLGATGLDPEAVVGLVPPRRGAATIEKVAINAVMAGCLPEYFPIVVAALTASLEARFNLYGLQATTNPASPAILVNGPLAHDLDINGGFNVFGQGWRANATIGRALRLVLQNVGGGRPGVLDRATHGWPGKYAFCFAENEAESPWEPLHVERGLQPEESAVTLIGVGAFLNIADLYSTTAAGLMKTICNSMGPVGTNNIELGGEPVLVLSPEHARLLADGGYSKARVKQEVWEQVRVPASRFSSENLSLIAHERAAVLSGPIEPDTEIPLLARPEDLIVLVAGGPGAHSVFMPTFGDTWSVTRAI